MEALTVWQPWAWAIGAGLKLVENRNWLPSWKRLTVGQQLAIHAGVSAPTRTDFAGLRAAARAMGREAEVPAFDSPELSAGYGRGRVIAVATFADVVRSRAELPEAQRPWWIGPYGWLLTDVRQLQLGSAPTERGQQGLWRLSPRVELLVTAQLRTTGPGALWRKTA